MKIKTYIISTVLLVSSCGINTDNDAAYILTDSELDPGILSPSPIDDDQTSFNDEQTVRLFFVNSEDKLTPVERPFREPTVNNVLDAVAGKVLARETRRHGFVKTKISSLLNPQVTFNNDTKLTIKVSDLVDLKSLALTDPESTTLIFGQIVCTLDGFLIDGEPISGIVITDSKGPITAQNLDSEIISGPAKISDFNNCI